MDTVNTERTIVKRHIQCVHCEEWLEEWEVHPEADVWMFCIPCGEKFLHDSDILRSIVREYIDNKS